jgi:hypothetical protein
MAEPIKPAQIPPTVGLSDADPERQQLYGEAGKVFTEERNKALAAKAAGDAPERKMFVPGQAEEEQPPEPESAPAKPEIEVDEADKRAFVRSILGDKTFEKVYPLFGGEVEVTFVDRTSAQMEQLLLTLDSVANDATWAKEADIGALCSSLREIKTKEGRKSFLPTDDYAARKQELDKLPRPLYEALLDTSRNFETLINHMIEKARDSDFWQAGGSASLSKRTAGAPSTSRPQAAPTRK